MTAAFFVTGTDTGVGKTLVACSLLEKANSAGLSTAAIKPVAAGCENTEEGLRNEDALLLQAACSKPLSYQQINPVALKPAIAPHLAAGQVGRRIQLDRLSGFCRGVFAEKADLTLVEGAGGWRVPISESELLSELALALRLPVILVVGLRLGCINHSLLTAEAIRRDGLPLAGWVANQVDKTAMDCQQENLATLEHMLPAPCLGVLPWHPQASTSALSQYLQLPVMPQASEGD